MEEEKKIEKSKQNRLSKYFYPKGINVEMMRYQSNKFCYSLSLMSIVFLLVGFCCLYSGTTISGTGSNFSLLGGSNIGVWMGVDILINILSMLFLLYISIRLNAYDVKCGYAAIGFGVFAILKIFLYPFSLFQAGLMSNAIFICVLLFYLLSGVCDLFAGAATISRGKALLSFLKSSHAVDLKSDEKAGKR